jgi:hypothetical protein
MFLDILNGSEIGHEKFSDATDLFLKWISKKNVFTEKLSINEWNHSVWHYFQNNDNNNRNSFLKSLSFNFFNSRNIKNFNEKTFLEFFNSKNFKNLNELFFRGLYCLSITTDDILILISNNFCNLKRLYISSCSEVTDLGIIAIAENCLKLEKISLFRSDYVTDLSLIVLAKKSLNLKAIDFQRCEQITCEGIVAISVNCLKLVNITFSKIKNVTDQHLIQISKNCSNLKILKLWRCSKISNNGLNAVAKNCLKLEKFCLSGNEHIITDLCLFEIANNCLNLKILILLNCTKITNNGLIAIVKKCLQLEELCCYYDNGFSNKKITFRNLDQIIENIICNK